MLYTHKNKVKLLCCKKNLLATMDEAGVLNIFDYENKKFICTDYEIQKLDHFPSSLKGLNFFDMEYPYFSSIDSDHYSFSTDYGIFTINFR